MSLNIPTLKFNSQQQALSSSSSSVGDSAACAAGVFAGSALGALAFNAIKDAQAQSQRKGSSQEQQSPIISFIKYATGIILKTFAILAGAFAIQHFVSGAKRSWFNSLKTELKKGFEKSQGLNSKHNVAKLF